MKFKLIGFLLSSLLLLSCNQHVREGNTNQQIIDTQKISQKNRDTIDPTVFLSLLETLPDETMRREGLQTISALKLKFQPAKKIPLSAIETLFDSLVENYPLKTHDKMLFDLSKVYQTLAINDAAISALDKLVSLYPAVIYLDEVQFRKANVLYAQRRFAAAEQVYKEVIAFRNSVYYERAVYQQGWSQYKQAHYDLALNSFMHLLDIHSRDGGLIFKNMNSTEKAFVEKIMHAINLSFDSQAGPVSAQHYFSKKQKRQNEYHVFLSLAEFYQQSNKISDAVKTYQLFVELNELHIQSPVFLLRVIELYRDGGFDDELLQARKDFVLRYGAQHVYWGLHSQVIISVPLLRLKENLLKLIEYYRAEKNSIQSSAESRQSQRWCRVFLNSFSDDENAWDVGFQLAQSLRNNKRYEMSAMQFEHLAYDYKAHKKSAQAAYAALLVHEKRQVELSGFEKKYHYKLLIDSARRFVKVFPDYAKTKNIKMQLLTNEYVVGDYDAAFKLFGKREWRQAAIAFESLRNHVTKPRLRFEITKKRALIYLQTNQFEKAIHELQQVSYDNDASNHQNDALWLAAELSEMSGNYKQAIKLYSSFIERFAFPLQRSIEARQHLIEIFDRTGEPLLATQWRVDLVNADAKGGKLRTRQTRYLAAKARLVLAESLQEGYRNASLKMPINENLKTKTNLLNDVSNAYKEAASYKVKPVISVATFRIAELNMNMSQAIMHSAYPDNLNEYEQQQYDVVLNKKAQVFKERAIQFHRGNVSRNTVEIDDAWIQKSADRLKELLN